MGNKYKIFVRINAANRLLGKRIRKLKDNIRTDYKEMCVRMCIGFNFSAWSNSRSSITL